MDIDEQATRVKCSMTLKRMERIVAEGQKRTRMRECCAMLGDNELKCIEEDVAQAITYLLEPINGSS
jgi:hypothetical protein